MHTSNNELCQLLKSDKDKSYTFDWISLTSDYVTYDLNGIPAHENKDFLNKLLKLLLSPLDFDQLKYEFGSGTNGCKWRCNLRPGVYIGFCGAKSENGRPIFQVFITGRGCIDFKTIKNFKMLFNFFQNYKYHFNWKRLDLAIDDFLCKELLFSYLYKKIFAGEFVSAFKGRPTFHHSNKEDITDGMSIYHGSATSERRIIQYDKQAERKAKSDYISDTPRWVRHEMRFKNNYSKDVAEAFLSSNDDNFGTFVSDIYNSLFRLVLPNENDGTKSRWPVDPLWTLFCLGIKESDFVSSLAERSKINRLKEYFTKSQGKVLTKLFACYYDHPDALDYLINLIASTIFTASSKLDTLDLQIINEYRLEHDRPLFEEKHVFDLQAVISELEIAYPMSSKKLQEIFPDDRTNEEISKNIKGVI